MPKPYTYPTLYNDVLQLSITSLKQWGYLKDGQTKAGKITWNRNENQTGAINIFVNTQCGQPYIELNYKYKNEPIKYKVFLTSVNSNLNKGKIMYFICPQTNKCCRKLYSIGGYFLHREAFNGCMYESQIKSKEYRQMNKTFGAFFKRDNLYSELYNKNFKMFYNGMLTKKYLNILKKLKKLGEE